LGWLFACTIFFVLDFIVREISLDGKVSKLTNPNGKELEDKHFIKDDMLDISGDLESIADNLLSSIISILNDINRSTDSGDSFLNFINQCLSKSKDCPLDYVGFPCGDKAARTKIHNLFKSDSRLSKLIDTETKNIDNIVNMRMIAKHKRKDFNSPAVKRKSNQKTNKNK
jgi:hypothetical protein